MKLMFLQIEIEGIIGSNYMSDIAIDDVTLRPGICGLYLSCYDNTQTHSLKFWLKDERYMCNIRERKVV